MLVTATIIFKCYYLILWLIWQHSVVIITFKYNGITFKSFVFPKICECYLDSYYYSATPGLTVLINYHDRPRTRLKNGKKYEHCRRT